GVFTRSGQICFAVKRIYIPQSMERDFTEALISRVQEYRVGHGLREGVAFGPMNNKMQFDKVNELIASTRDTGADIVELGTKDEATNWDNGYYMLPHVVRNAEHSSQIATCEQFGPVIPLISYPSVDQAVEWANDSEYGLGSSVWTSDPEEGFAVANRIDSGSTFINSHAFESLDLRMPFGGIKHSGLGREFGEAGMRSYVEEHAVRLLK
ncbi:MAG: Aldehyde Dehydrogenase, partial [Citricoccus sp.]|nr:Aldehyde Dehydrogenase [Citricoccus sp. WCRC_4]